MVASSPMHRCRKPPILALAYISPARSSKRRMSSIFWRTRRQVSSLGRSCWGRSTPASSGVRASVASSVAIWLGGYPLGEAGLLHVEQVDHEDEGLVGPDGWRRGLVGRDGEPPPAPDLHALEALVPARDDHPGAELEREGLLALPRGVELLAA